LKKTERGLKKTGGVEKKVGRVEKKRSPLRIPKNRQEQNQVDLVEAAR